MSDVFISYSHKDMRRADQVRELLTENGVSVWKDTTNTRPGDRLTDAIFPAIEAAKCLLVVYTKSSAKAEWVQREVAHAVRHAKPILLVSFGRVSFNDSFPEDFADMKRISVDHYFTKTLKLNLVHWVTRTISSKLCPVVTMLNIKGGVGKTILSANLFGCIHEHLNKSVLMIDLDPQHNLTQLLLDPRRANQAQDAGQSVMALFRGVGDRPIKVAAERCCYSLKGGIDSAAPRIDIVPGSFELITFFLGRDHQHFDSDAEQWVKFRHMMDHFRRTYDLIVIDVNPGASLMTEIALDASTHVLSPVKPDRFSGHGLHLLDVMLNMLDITQEELKLLVIMNGVKRGEAEEIETALLDDNQQNWARERSILKSRIGYSKKLEARLARALTTDLTANLAYHSSWGGGHAIRNDLIAAAHELEKELQL